MNLWGTGRQFTYNESTTVKKYHGLINQGATCYLNSVLQVLFMTEDFGEAVERHTIETPGPIDHHLIQLFKDLKENTANIYKITKTLGINRGLYEKYIGLLIPALTPSVYEQRDAAEYFEKILSLTSPKASQIFHGRLTQKNICSQCCTEKDNDEAFWHLPLALVDSFGKEDYSVVKGIKEYFRPSVFSGENQMYCDECDAKSDATNKCVIKHHPEVLMLLLKRFEFDYSYMSYVKIYCTVDIPYTLQIPENQTYELYAVVDHFGDLRSGHYIATIKDDESWYLFNDDRVTLLDYQPFQVDNFEKSSTAYLLFYRKPKVHAADQDIGEESTPGGFLPATSDIYEQREDAGKIRERDEVEGAAEAGNDKQSDEGKIRMDDEEDMRGNAQAGKRETQLEECFKDQDNDSGRLDDVRRRRPDINHVYKDGKTGDNEQSEKKIKSLTKYLNNNVEHPDNEQNISGGLGGTQEVGQDDQRCEQISRSTNKKHEQQRKEKRDVKRVKEQKRGHDNCQDVEDQNNEGLDDIRQNQSEQKITDTHSRHKDICVVKQGKEQEDDHVQNRADSPLTRAGSSGSRRLTENQVVSSVEKTRHGDSRPRGVGRSPEPCFNEEVQDHGVYARESKPIKHQERNEEINDFLYLQDAQAVKQRDEGKIMMGDEEDMGGNAEAGKREPSSRETQLEESVEDQDNDSGRLDDVRQRRPDINHVYKDGKTGDNEQSEKKRKSLTKYLNSNVEHPDNKQNISGGLGGTQEVGQDDQRCEQRSRSTNKKHEQQRKEKRDVKGAKEQKRGHDNCQDVEDQNNEGLDDIKQRYSEQNITIRHTRHKDVGVVKQAKEQGNKRDEHIQNQVVSSVEKTRHADPPPKARTGFNENTIEGRRDPEQSRPGGNVKRKPDPKINAEVSLSESDMKLSEATSQEPQKCRPRRFTGKTQEEIETHSTVDTNARTKRKVSDTQEQDAEMKHEKKKRKWWRVSASKKEKREKKIKHKETTGCLPLKSQKNSDKDQHTEEKRKQGKTVGCFSFSRKSQKKTDPTSESD